MSTSSNRTKVDLPEAFAGLFKPSRYKAFYGGRGSAKSHSFATSLLIAGGKEPLRILCAREVQNSIKDSVKQLLDDKIAAMNLGSFYESIQNEIRGKNGTLFIFSGLGKITADQLKSMAGVNRCWIEEAQTISARSLEILRPTIREPDSEIWFSWNPRHSSDPVDQMFRGEVTPENAIIQKVNYDKNPFFPDVLEQERVFDHKNAPDRYSHIWLGEYEPSLTGAIFDRQTLHENRRSEAPELKRIVVAVDPAVTTAETGKDPNETGIIVAGVGEDRRGYVLEDFSCHGTPHQWASKAIAAYDKHEADSVVIEVNQGGDMVRHTLQSIRPGLPITEVRATRGKHVRAEPISALYSLGRVSHVGTFPELESQQCQMTAAGFEGDGSPDRVDALVWAFTELFSIMTRPNKRKPYKEMPQVSWMG